MMPPQDPGTLSMTWVLANASQQPITCMAANAANVFVNIVEQGTGNMFGQTFPCSLGTAVTGSLPSASFDLSFSLYDAQSSLITSAMSKSGVMVTPDHTTDIGQVVFTVP